MCVWLECHYIILPQTTKMYSQKKKGIVTNCCFTLPVVTKNFLYTFIFCIFQIFFGESEIIFIYFFNFCLFAISWATPTAYGGSQARGQIRVVAAGLCQSHSNSRPKPRLQPTPQLTCAVFLDSTFK